MKKLKAIGPTTENSFGLIVSGGVQANMVVVLHNSGTGRHPISLCMPHQVYFENLKKHSEECEWGGSMDRYEVVPIDLSQAIIVADLEDENDE